MRSGLPRAVVVVTLLVCAALVGALVFTLFRGDDTASSAGDGTAAAPAPPPVSPGTPAMRSSRPMASPTRPVTTTRRSVPADPAAGSPKFRAGQWIALIDTYPTDGGLPAEQTAKELAGQLAAAGVGAKALLADGQYPGLAKGDGTRLRDAWIVYVGPSRTSAAARNICAASKTQQVYSSPACPTFEPARS